MNDTPNPFDEAAPEYDAWFDSEEGRGIFAQEVECLRRVAGPLGGRWLEVGAGTGRFAVALGVKEGVEPSASMRMLAARRRVRVADATAEELPYADGSFDGVLMTTALCFLADPKRALGECYRVLNTAGRLLIGLIPADSPWGQLYAQKAAEGHPIYRAASFHTCSGVIRLGEEVGFVCTEAYSCLTTPPDLPLSAEQPRHGIVPGAGFVAMLLDKACPARQPGNNLP